MTNDAARELYERQMRYDRLHHAKRAAWLRSRPRLLSFERDLLRQSERCLSFPSEGYRSVDLSNAAYLAELDAFEAARTTPPAHLLLFPPAAARPASTNL